MNFAFVPMNDQYARSILDTWKYEPPYDYFNYDRETELMLNSKRWGHFMFAVLNEQCELVGELNTEFYGQNDEYLEQYEDGATLWIGFGLRPDLTGQGLGAGFVSACIDHAVKHHGYRGKYVRLATATFNQRGIKAYSKIGFEEVPAPADTVVWMRKRLR